MTPTNTANRPPRRGEAGAVSVFVAITMIGLLMVAGMVFDGGRILAARRDAIDTGRGAARAGTQAVVPAVPGSGGVGQLDPARARYLAERYLAAAGYRGEVDVTADTVTVTVHARVAMAILPIGDRNITVHADARPVNGRQAP